MKYDASTRTQQFTSEQEVDRFHSEVTALLREAVSAASHHGVAKTGKLAAQAVFWDFASVMRAPPMSTVTRSRPRRAGVTLRTRAQHGPLSSSTSTITSCPAPIAARSASTSSCDTIRMSRSVRERGNHEGGAMVSVQDLHREIRPRTAWGANHP